MKVRYVVALLTYPFVLLAGGTSGYMLVEGWSFKDALYMTVITVTTVGYGETHALSSAGRWFTMALALGGIFTLFFATSTAIALALSGDLSRMASRLHMKHKLAKLTDHVIVCGSGRMGRLVAQALIKEGVTVVLVDRDEQALGALKSELIIGIGGDASSDELLAEVGITRARALVATLGSDADNVFLTLSARALSPKLFIVSRAVEEGTEAKLVRAGANRVVAPFAVGGFVAANAILHPAVLDSLDLAQRTGHLEVQVEEMVLRKELRGVRAPLDRGAPPRALRGVDRRAAPHQPRRGLQPPRRHRPLGERHPRRHGAAARARSAGALDSRLLRVRPHPSPGPRPLVR